MKSKEKNNVIQIKLLDNDIIELSINNKIIFKNKIENEYVVLDVVL